MVMTDSPIQRQADITINRGHGCDNFGITTKVLVAYLRILGDVNHRMKIVRRKQGSSDFCVLNLFEIGEWITG